MQLQLPLYPIETKLISSCLGVYKKEGIVQYIANGLPVFSHLEGDIQSFRYITSNFILQGLCRQSDVSACFCIPIDSIKRNLKKLSELGESAFFSAENRHGYCHKIRGAVLVSIQKKLDGGMSVNATAKSEGLSEGSIRYAITKGYLKKKTHQL